MIYFTRVITGPSEMSYTEFVKEGWKSLRNFGHQNIKDCFYARELVIEPIIEKVRMFFGFERLDKYLSFITLNMFALLRCSFSLFIN